MRDTKIDTSNKNYVKDNNDKSFRVTGWGYRHQQCLILFFALTIAYSLRASMGVSLVAMMESDEDLENSIKSTHIDQHDNVTIPEFEFEGILNRLMLVPPYPKLRWSKQAQDSVLASFFWGYMLLQIPASQLAHRFGSRYLLFGSLTINSVVSLVLPLASYSGGWALTVICRIAQGLSQACIVPGMHSFFGKWAPLEERSRLTALSYGGQALGVVLGLPIAGFIAATPMGWPGIFRFYGILCAIVAVVLWFMIADNPRKHPKISYAERQYIEEGLGQKDGEVKKYLPVPWGKILRCRSVYAIIIAHIGQSYGQVTLFSEIPAFMDKVMGVNIKANGLLSALPFFVMWLTNFFFSWFTDMLIVKRILSVTNARKLATTIGYLPAALGLILLAFVPKNLIVVEAILVVVCAFKISASVGFMVNHIDLSPNFAGTLMSLSNFVSNLCGSISPIVAGVILTDITSERQWGFVFIGTGIIYLVSCTVYLLFAEAEKAEWDTPEEQEKDLPEAISMLEKSARKITAN